MTKGSRIKALRESAGLSQVALAQMIGVSKQTLYKYENDIITNIPSDKIEEIAKAVGVDPSYIMGWEERPIYESYGLMPVTRRMFPVIGEIACGLPAEAIEIPIDIVEGQEYDADYALVAKGDSMTGAEIYDGDIILIKTMPMVNNGEIAAVRIDGSTTLKYVYWYPDRQQLVLQAANPAYPPLSYEGEELQDAEILGKAVKLQRNI